MKITLAIGLLLFIIVFYFSGNVKLFAILQGINWIWFVLAFFVQIAIILLYTLRLKIILEAQKYYINFRKMFKILVSGMSVNQLTPVVKIGGEPVKVYYISKNNIPSTKALASIIIEISAELVSLYTTLLFLVFLLSSMNYLSSEFFYAALSIFVFFVISFILVFRILFREDKIEDIIRKYIQKFFKTNAKTASKLFSSSLKTLFVDKKLEFKIFAISFFSRFLEILRIYLIFKAIECAVPINLILSVWVLQFLFSMVPWLPGGLGLVEGGTISALIFLGIPAEISASLILLDRILNLWLPVILGFFSVYLLKKEYQQEDF